MRFDQLFVGRYLKSAELEAPTTFTIKTVTLEELEGDSGKKEMKAIVQFADSPKLWVLNRTNGLCVKELFGAETDAWTGKKVTLYSAKIDFGDSNTAIRVLGSPDISQPVTFSLKLPRKKPFNVTLQVTNDAKA